VAGAGGGLVVGPIPGGFGGVGGGKGMLVGPGGGGAPLGALPPGATPLGGWVEVHPSLAPCMWGPAYVGRRLLLLLM
jgi:hypothetical protein